MRMLFLASAVLMVANGLAAPAQAAPSLTRGPYLQVGTHDAISIRWRTSEATDSRVNYGAGPASLGYHAEDAALTTEHEVRLTGLSPAARYFYDVGSGAGPLAGGDSSYSFATSPPTGPAAATRVWVVGDAGLGNAGARQVRDAYALFTGARPTDLWLILGDNAYFSGTDAEYQAGVFDMYPKMLRQSVAWPTRGNHDVLHTGGNNDYYDIFTMPTAAEAGGVASGTEAYYSFDRANIHFICLDSEGSDRSRGGAMMTWLRADLSATGRDWVILFWHHPPYSKGSHDSDNDLDSGARMGEMRRNALPILDSLGVDLVLSGHSHSYERSILVDGHYGVSSTLVSGMKVDSGDGRESGGGAYRKHSAGRGPHEGTVYAVAGSSSQVSGGPLNHPVMTTSLNVMGSMVIDVSARRLDAVFLDDQGAPRDSFTIVKAPESGVGGGAAGALQLAAPEPNPSRGAARLTYSLPRSGQARLSIVDASGRHVALLLEGAAGPGSHVLSWNGRSDSGRPMPDGLYFAMLQFAGETRTRKVTLLR